MTGRRQVTEAAQATGADRLRPVVHRITTSTAAVVNEPTHEQLAGLLDEVARSGRGSFLVAQCRRREQRRTGQCRTGQPGEASLQAVRHAGGWILESREDLANSHVRTEIADADRSRVEDVFAWWMQDLPAWRGLDWQPVVRNQHWLTCA